MKRRVLILPALLLAMLTPAWAQKMSRQNDPARATTAPRMDRALSNFGTVTGSVMTVDGAAIRDAHIEIHDMMGRVVSSGYSLPNGTFELGNLPLGHYEVVATSGIQEARQQIDVDGGISPVSLRMAPREDASGSHSISVAEMKVPEKARQAVRKAEEAFEKHKLDEARKQVEKALQIAPGFAHALTLRAVLRLNDNQLDQAQQDVEMAIKSDDHFGMAYLVLGAVYNLQAHYDDALRALRQGLTLVPNSWQGYFESAKALLAKAQFAESLRASDRAAQLAPSHYPPIHLVRAQALLGLKNYGDAVTELEQYLGGEPNGADSAQARKTLNDVRAFLAQQKK